MSLTEKYNIAAPRYTSYPTVPLWDQNKWSAAGWINTISGSDIADGISLYIHLPFCESLCTYCGCNTRITKNHGVEAPYIDAVLKEWSMYRRILNTRPKIKELHLGGGTPTFFSPENLDRLIKGILEHADTTGDSGFSFEAHPANTSPEHLKTLYNLGFRRLSLGIQDFDPVVQDIINRKQSVQDVELVCEEARRLGYTSINFDLIYGLPLQRAESIRETIADVIRLRPDRIAYYSYAHVPWIKPGQRRFTELDLPVGDEKRKLYEIGRQLLSDAGYLDIGMDHFSLPDDELWTAYLNGTLHRNFMGYTPTYTRLLIGLGVSAIGDSWLGFAQNEKNVEQYLQLIGENQLPVKKGHLLTDDDISIRQVILDIMCRNKTSLSSLAEYKDDIMDRLLPLQQDGLLNISYEEVQVTPVGFAFLRNVCMAFDLRLWQQQPTQNLFSTSA